METKREGVKDVIRGYLQLRLGQKLNNAYEHACEMADLIFLALGISEAELDASYEVPLPRILPIVEIGGKRYFRDDRLRQFRNVKNPDDFIDFRCERRVRK